MAEMPKTRKPKQDPKNAAIAALQNRVDRICALVNDGPVAYSVLARRAAKNGVPRETVTAGFQAVQEALQDCATGIKTAYDSPTSRQKRVSRVKLLG